MSKNDNTQQFLDEINLEFFKRGCNLGFEMGFDGKSKAEVEAVMEQIASNEHEAFRRGISKGFEVAIKEIELEKRKETLKQIDKSKSNEKGMELER